MWTGSMMFFQAALLASYLYVHLTTSWLGARRQAIVHLVLVLLPLSIFIFAGPVDVPGEEWAPPADSNPLLWLLGLLAVAVGLPFFAVAATNPLIQRWLADTEHPSAKDPYFLYRASNLGSVIGLLGYPLLVERELVLESQGWAWTLGYGLLVALVILCAALLWRSAPAAQGEEGEGPEEEPGPPAPAGTATAGGGGSLGESLAYGLSSSPTLLRRLRWIGLTFVPSSLMLGVTAFITTDITPIPLLWVIPLSLYLFSFVVVFSPSVRVPDILHKAMVLALPIVAALLVITILDSELRDPYWLLILLHILGFFVVAMVCHGEVARDRPPVRHLTEFYLWVAVGGLLGGVFNALLAPVVFDTVVEYPLVIVLACLFLPGAILAQVVNRRRNGESQRDGEEERGPDEARRGRGVGRLLEPRLLDLVLPVALGVTVVALSWAIEEFVEDPGLNDTASKTIIYLGAAACLYFAYFSNRPVRFGLGVAAVIVAATIATGTGNALYEDRSFFGVYQVTGEEEGAGHHELVAGDTNHGAQFLGTTPPQPITYYHRTGPIGQLFEALPEGVTSRPAVIGLGTGTMACYNRPGQQLDFYEIDPLIERVARNENLFTYLRDCPGEFNVNLGDARLSLGEVPDGSYGVIVGDAFSSDAIPVHLITREALDLYFSKLQSNGVVALHISNRHLELEPVLGNLAQDSGLACRAQLDTHIADAPGKFVSHWVVMARQEDHLAGIAEDERWMPCATAPSQSVWTDDYSNLLSTFTWD